MGSRPSAVINRLAQNRSAIVGYHRFVNNPKVNYQAMMNGHYYHVVKRVQGKDLLCIQDTSEYNYDHHRNILKKGELGTISDNQSLGLRVHPMMVMDLEDGFPYGFSSFQIINRAGKLTDRYDRNYKSLPIEEKESFRWISSVEETKTRLRGANSLTIVADRESDIYQLWSRVLDERTHLVIRTPFHRKFLDEHDEEISRLSSLVPLGTYQIYVSGRLRKRVKARTATLEVLSQKAFTVKPRSLRKQKGNTDPEKIPLNIVVARESISDGAKDIEPIEWILLTDKSADTLEEAMEVIDNYKSRWNIEQLFRLTKQKGFGLEESQLETAHGLQNMIALVFIAAIRIFQMVKGRDNQDREAIDIFNEEEIEVLTKINPSLEGKSEKTKNRNKPNTLAYLIWTIARLGGWKPEDRDPPGPITFKRGWDTLSNYLMIARMAPP